MRAIGYVRVSSQAQVSEGVSLQRQEDQIRAFCAYRGVDLVEVIREEGVSGFKSSRPGFCRMVDLCKTRQVEMVIVYDLSRLSRSVRGTLEFVEDVIQKLGITFVSLQQDIDTSSPIGKAFLGFTAIFNQLYRDEIAFKTKAALRHKRERGQKTGGIVPFGFEATDEGALVSVEAEERAIAAILSARSAGRTFREIARELEIEGVPTKTGRGKWSHSVVRGIVERYKSESAK